MSAIAAAIYMPFIFPMKLGNSGVAQEELKQSASEAFFSKMSSPFKRTVDSFKQGASKLEEGFQSIKQGTSYVLDEVKKDFKQNFGNQEEEPSPMVDYSNEQLRQESDSSEIDDDQDRESGNESDSDDLIDRAQESKPNLGPTLSADKKDFIAYFGGSIIGIGLVIVAYKIVHSYVALAIRNKRTA